MLTKKKKLTIVILATACLLIIGGFFLYIYVIDGMLGYECPVAFNYDIRTGTFNDTAFNSIVSSLENGGINYRVEPGTVNGTRCSVLLVQGINSDKAIQTLHSDGLYNLYPDLVA
ncbi:MAG: hypothetical protein J6A19_04415 [Oscillospiraceae bacterium]|nr:hypothetical protein [Oscillospiraceae bacterium]